MLYVAMLSGCSCVMAGERHKKRGEIVDPQLHEGLIHMFLKHVGLRPGTLLYEEAEAEAMYAMVKAIKYYRPKKGQYNTYAGTCARNAVISVMRKSLREMQAKTMLADGAKDDDNWRQTGRAVELVNSCIDQLDPLDAAIVRGKMTGVSFRSLARQLKMSYSAVKMRYHCALCNLKTLLLHNDVHGVVSAYVGE